MNKPWKVVLAFIVVFVAGAASGWVVALRHDRQAWGHLPPRPQVFGAQLMGQWLRRNQLNLTDDQRAKIRPVVFDAAENLRRLRREDGHSAQLIIEKMQDEIANVLTPEQRNKFNDMIQQQRNRLQHFVQEQQRLQAEQRRQSQQAPPPP